MYRIVSLSGGHHNQAGAVKARAGQGELAFFQLFQAFQLEAGREGENWRCNVILEGVGGSIRERG